jgi:hypothetical protein
MEYVGEIRLTVIDMAIICARYAADHAAVGILLMKQQTAGCFVILGVWPTKWSALPDSSPAYGSAFF